jgi:cytochrome c oxidase assembly protein subunit 15
MSHSAIRHPQSAFLRQAPHALAVVLVCATFPLIWLGGMVTSRDAGMAVPDWPNTYGYNLLLYPWKTWILGPLDIFIEHGHRLLGALAGMITIALVFTVWACDRRRWVLWLAIACLVAVIAQGILGGLRVRLDATLLARIHGIVGPAFFGLTIAMAAVTSRWWENAKLSVADAGAGRLHRLAIVTAALVYLQLIIGAHLRHLPLDGSPRAFRVMVFFHLIVAAALFIHILLLAARVVRRHRKLRTKLLAPALVLVVLMLAQVALGSATWVVTYSYPSWLSGFAFAAGHTVQASSYSQSLIVTAHQAMGSLILAVAVLISLRSLRLVRSRGAAGASLGIIHQDQLLGVLA